MGSRYGNCIIDETMAQMATCAGFVAYCGIATNAIYRDACVLTLTRSQAEQDRTTSLSEYILHAIQWQYTNGVAERREPACQKLNSRQLIRLSHPSAPGQSKNNCRKTRELERRNPTPRIHLPAKARRAGGAEKIVAAPSLQRTTLGPFAMNEAETRAEHIDPALEGGGLGRGRGQPHPARISDHAGPHRRTWAARQATDRRLCAGLSQHQAGGRRGQGVG